MNENELNQMAQQIITLLEDYEIPVESLSLLLTVSNTYYEDLKHGFPERAVGMAFNVWRDNWVITMAKSLFKETATTENRIFTT
jgi:hypothetical protein